MQRFTRFSFLVLVVLSMLHLQACVTRKAEPEVKQDPGSKVSTIDLRPEFERLKLTPRSQGARGTCSVFVMTEAFEFAVSKAANKTIRLSPEYANWAGDQRPGAPDDGACFFQVIDGVTTHGLCLESAAPYKKDYDPLWSPSKEVRAAAVKNHRLATKKLGLEVVWIAPLAEQRLSDANIRKSIDVLREGWPVGIGAYHSTLLVGFEGDPQNLESGVFHVLDSASCSFHTVDYNWMHKEVGDAFYVRCKKSGNVDLK